jgi:hypothetical protein
MAEKSNLIAFSDVAGEPRVRIIIVEDLAIITYIARTILLAAIMRE